MAKLKRSQVRSGLEFDVVSDLSARKAKFEYEPWRIEYQPKPRWYTPDLVLPNGIVIEIKGRLTVFDRTKHLLIKDQWPDLDVRFIFKYDNKLNKKAKSRYSDWCEKHGFLYAFETVPQEWIDA